MDQFEDDEPVRLEIGDVLDLHTFRPAEIRDVTEEYLRCARAEGFTTVRIIHGKGKGVQRRIVRSLAESIPWVTTVSEGGPGGGGWGATVLTLAPEVADE